MERFFEFILNIMLWVFFEALPFVIGVILVVLVVTSILYFWFVVVLKIKWGIG